MKVRSGMEAAIPANVERIRLERAMALTAPPAKIFLRGGGDRLRQLAFASDPELAARLRLVA
ncbi:MAG: hypothetical protein R3F37_00105 [Candidatus Competibacteraceae bacterium]